MENIHVVALVPIQMLDSIKSGIYHVESTRAFVATFCVYHSQTLRSDKYAQKIECYQVLGQMVYGYIVAIIEVFRPFRTNFQI